MEVLLILDFGKKTGTKQINANKCLGSSVTKQLLLDDMPPRAGVKRMGAKSKLVREAQPAIHFLNL